MRHPFKVEPDGRLAGVMPEEIFAWCLKRHRGLAVGEIHPDTRARFWIRSMLSLGHFLGVRWFFVEHFNRDRSSLLDELRAWGKQERRDFLTVLNPFGWREDGTHVALSAVVSAAFDLDLRVEGIDATEAAKARMQAARDYAWTRGGERAWRQMMAGHVKLRNELWQQHVQSRREAIGSDKFLIWCGMGHTGPPFPVLVAGRAIEQGIDGLLAIPSLDVISAHFLAIASTHREYTLPASMSANSVYQNGGYSTFAAVV